MKLTVDANVFFASLIKDSLARKALLHPMAELYAPEFLITETSKYKNLIKTKSKLSEQDCIQLLNALLSNIAIIKHSELADYTLPASKLTTDEKDVIYLACALYTNSSLLTNDKNLENQTRVKTFNLTTLAKQLKII